MFGILLDQHKTVDTVTSLDLMISLFAPIVVPIIIGMRVNDKRDEK
jgi:hypothetical protein